MKYFKESSLDKTHDELKWKNKIKNNPEEAVWEINKKNSRIKNFATWNW